MTPTARNQAPTEGSRQDGICSQELCGELRRISANVFKVALQPNRKRVLIQPDTSGTLHAIGRYFLNCGFCCCLISCFFPCELLIINFAPVNGASLSKCQPLLQSGLLPHLPCTSIFIFLIPPFQLLSGLGLFLCVLWITDPLYHGLPQQWKYRLWCSYILQLDKQKLSFFRVLIGNVILSFGSFLTAIS